MTVEEVYKQIKKSRGELLDGSRADAVKLSKEALKAILTAETQIEEGLERLASAAKEDQILLDEVVNRIREEELRVAQAKQAALYYSLMAFAWDA